MPVRPPVLKSPYAAEPNAYERERGTARERGYNKRWDRVSILYRRAHPLCLGCQAIGRVMPTQVVDHIIPHRGDYNLMWDERNWQPACAWHHDVIKQRLELAVVQGQANVNDLRLDSGRAKRLSIELG